MTNRSKNRTSAGRSDKEKKQEKVGGKRKSGKQNQPSPGQKAIKSPDKASGGKEGRKGGRMVQEKQMNKKSSSRRVTSKITKVTTEDKTRVSNKRTTSSMGTVTKKADKVADEVVTTSRTQSKASSEGSGMGSTETSVSPWQEKKRTEEEMDKKEKKRTEEEMDKKEKKRLSKDLNARKLKRIQTARKLDEKVNRCRTKGRSLMVGQVDARQDIERAETNLKDWTRQFNQQMNELKEYLTKEMGEIRNGMKELEEMEIKSEMEAKHVGGAKLPEESLLRTIKRAVREEGEEEEGDGEWMQRCITGEEEETKEMAIECASGLGEGPDEVLLEFLQDESSDIREKAAIVLGERVYGSGTRLNPFVLRIGREKEYGRSEEKEEKEEKGMNLFDAMVDNPYKESRLIGECAYTREILQRINL